jgi:SNF2 family DNA or RNA helicase
MSIVRNNDGYLILEGYKVNSQGTGLCGPEPALQDYPAYAVFQELALQGLAGTPDEDAKVSYADLMAYSAHLDKSNREIKFSKWDESERLFRDLGLPEIYAGPVYIEASAALGTPESALRVRFPQAITPSGPVGDQGLKWDGILLVNSREDIQYTCSSELFSVLEAVEEYNTALNRRLSKDEILLQASQVSQRAEHAQVQLGPVLSSEKILEPSQISLQFEEHDGAVSVVPQADIPDIQQGAFGEKFKKRLDVPSVYNFERQDWGRIRVALPDKKRKALEKIKRDYQGIRDPEKLRKFLENPPLEFDEAELDVSALYSDRVKELGIYRPKSWPFICSYETEWIPGIMLEEDGVKTPYTIKTDEDIYQLEQAIAEAEQAGKDYIEYKDKKVDLDVARKALDAAKEKKEGNFKDSKHAAEKLTLIIEENIETLEYSEEAGTEDFKQPDVDVPGLASGIVLKEYQKQGISRLLSLYQARCPGALLADDMGLGKTIQALSFLEILGHTEKGVFACIVAPKSLIENWIAEYEKYFPDGVLLLENAMGKGEFIQKLLSMEAPPHNLVILFSYETLRMKQLDICALRWDIAILDEAQRIKTVGTLVTNAAKALNARFKVAMTGTPVENTFHDLWCIADFSLPGFLGSARSFGELYNPSPEDGEHEIRRKGELLLERLGKRFLRRIKDDVLKDLPPKYESDNPAHAPMFQELSTIKIMPDPQRYAYDGVIADYQNRLRNGEFEGRRGMLDILHKLKRACEHPSFVLPDRQQSQAADIEDSAKTICLIEILNHIKNAGEKAIIFSEYRHTQRFLAAAIHEVFGIRPDIINGDTPTGGSSDLYDESRMGIVKRFNEKTGFDVIIMSPVAAGVGLNVTGANHVIHFSRHWNPAKEDQATDRAYRIGQNKPVYVYYLIARHPRPEVRSFDDSLARLLIEKRRLRGAVLYPVTLQEVKPEDVFRASVEEANMSEAGYFSPLHSDHA